MWKREEILVICNRRYKFRKKCGYFYHLLNKHKIFHLLGLCLQRLIENLYATHPTVIALMVKDVMTLNAIFSIFSVARLINLLMYLKICH